MRCLKLVLFQGLSLAGLLISGGCANHPHTNLASAASARESQRSTGVVEPTLDDLVRRELLEGDALLIGAGDIVRCDKDLPPAQATAKLIDRFPGATVFT